MTSHCIKVELVFCQLLLLHVLELIITQHHINHHTTIPFNTTHTLPSLVYVAVGLQQL